MSPPTTLFPPELQIALQRAQLNVETCQLTIELRTDRVGFAFDSARLDDDGRKAVALLAPLFDESPAVQVLGFTSSEGSLAYNVDLSQRRADAVVAVLRPLLPATTQVTGVGRGPAEQVADNHDEATRAPNRRVMIRGTARRKVCAS